MYSAESDVPLTAQEKKVNTATSLCSLVFLSSPCVTTVDLI